MPLRPITLFVFLAAALAVAVALVPVTLPSGPGSDGGAFDRKLRAYLLTHPEVIVEAVATLQRRDAAARSAAQRAAVRANRAAILSGGPLPVAGNPMGDVTVVEFFDYRCPYCRQAFAQVKAVLAADANVRLVLKEFPVLGPESLYASRAAIAASMQGKYHALHDALMTRGGELTATAILEIARSVGLDMERLKADMTKPEVSGLIGETMALAQRLSITGTPTFIIGDDLIAGLAGVEELKAAIALARRK